MAKPDVKVALEDGRVISVPDTHSRVDGKPPRDFYFEGKHYEHTSEDEAGRWVYRPWP